MKKLIPFAIFAIFSSSFIASSALGGSTDKALYGNDNRQEAYEVADQNYINFAHSVAAKVVTSDLTFQSDNTVDFKKQTLHEFNYTLSCPDMNFRDQYVLAQCTGFLVAPDILVTAGHCIKNESDCANAKWIFDYVDGVEQFQTSQIYSCAKILEREEIDKWYKTMDYAVIKLDRIAEGRTPLKFRTKGKPKKNTPIAVIGFPQGLPMKFTDSANIKKLTSRTFWANTDTFVGNSGSPVFNLQTNEVEGIVYRGQDDYNSTTDSQGNFCVANKVYSESELGEGMIRISKIKFLKGL